MRGRKTTCGSLGGFFSEYFDSITLTRLAQLDAVRKVIFKGSNKTDENLRALITAYADLDGQIEVL